MAFRRRPLVRGAMVGGAAYYAGSKVAQGKAQDAQQQQEIEALQAQQAAQYQQPVAPPQPPAAPVEQPPAQASVESMAQQLTALKDLLDKGILTQEEFDAEKAKILQG
jgi:hypothetical protein